MSRAPASAQAARLGVEAIEEGVVRLAGGAGYRAVLEVGSVNLGLEDDARREAILAGYAAFLNSLTFPVQVLVRAVPVDVERYLGELEQRARHVLRDTPLADLARDHVAFVRRLARNRTLLERRFYLVVPAGAGVEHRGGWWPLLLAGRRRAPVGGTDTTVARRQLAFRCDEVARQLARCELPARRLGDLELAQLFYACWCPELSRVQRLRRTLAEYTAFVVQAAAPETTGPAPPAAAGHPHDTHERIP